MPELLIDPILLMTRLVLVASMFILVRSFARWSYVHALLCLPATMFHELAHLLVGILLRAQPVGFSLLPKRVPGVNGLVTGHVSFANLTWWRALPVATAPLYLLLPAGLWLVMASLHVDDAGKLLWCFGALQCFMGAWPSSEDWRLARTTIYVLLAIAIALLLGLAYFGTLPLQP